MVVFMGEAFYRFQPMEDSQTPWNDEVTLVKQGNEAAAKRLVEALYPMVIKIVRAHKHRTDDEDDISQDIFMKVFTKIDQYSGSQPLPHWVSRIAMNTCYDRLRKHRVRKVMSFSELSLDESHLLGRALTEDLEQTESRESATELVNSLLETLKPREQMVIRLMDLEEKSVQEVAAITGWGDSKIKVTAHRARKKLTATLKRIESTAMAKV
jgi:RNA polymerase sigma factor (sigma-70 family)